MNVELLFFCLVAGLALGSAVLMVTRRNPIVSALYLIVNLFCLALMYLLLHAQFIAIIQILVYAGAIMVLFLFVIMLLNLGDETRLGEKRMGFVGIALATVVFLEVLVGLRMPAGGGPASIPASSDRIGTVEQIGKSLFTEYLVPFEATSVVLLAAMVGVLVLAKKRFE